MAGRRRSAPRRSRRLVADHQPASTAVPPAVSAVHLAVVARLVVLVVGGLNDMLAFRSVCKAALCAAEEAGSVWRRLCAATFAGKVYVPRRALELQAAGSFRAALMYAAKDSHRTEMTFEELTSFTWHARVKFAAGAAAVSCPWWAGGPCNLRRYHADGTVRRVLRAPVPITYTAHGPRQDVPDDDKTNAALPSGPAIATWRFARTSCSRRAPHGGLVRTRNLGRVAEQPCCTVLRNRHTWGFVLDGCWNVSTSWAMPKRGEDPALDDENLPTTEGAVRPEIEALKREHFARASHKPAAATAGA